MNPLFLDFDDDTFETILHSRARNNKNRRFLSHLRDSVPRNEWKALATWIETFFGYQQNWLLDTSRRSILVKSRQTGGSHTYAAVAVLWAMLGEKTAIISVGQREADRVLKYASLHLQALCEWGSKWAVPVRSNAETIEISTRGRINSLPPTSGARGDSTHVILDEAAYYKNPSPEKVIEAAFGATTHGLRVRVLSTPNGIGNKFYDLAKEADKQDSDWTFHSVTIEQAIADGLNVSIESCWAIALNDPRIFGQMYGCSFLDNEFQYIPGALIANCSVDHIEPWDTRNPPTFYAGMDLGRVKDLTVLISIRRYGENDKGKSRFALADLSIRKRTNTDDIKSMVANGFNTYRYKRLTIDATGMGQHPSEELVRIHGVSKLEPFVFTMKSKEDLATSLFSGFADKRFIIPANLPGVDPEQIKLLKQDIMSIQRIITETGNVRFDAPSNANGHADRAWALALALNSALKAPTYSSFSW